VEPQARNASIIGKYKETVPVSLTEEILLEKDPFVHAAQIRVRTRNAVVTLEGLVTNATEKDMAGFDAWSVFGVDKVINALAVRQ
jgi:osmotically-inducible protein OsmY